MRKQILCLAVLLGFLALIFSHQTAFAHESIAVGDYTLEVGWRSEPPVVGQHNAITVQVTTKDSEPVDDISALTLTISYGGQEKLLSLEPQGEQSPGEFMAPILPTVAGEYTVVFGGTLGDTAVNAETHVEEVQPADTLAFPKVDSARPGMNNFGMTEWLAAAGFVSGLAGLVLSLFNMRKGR